MLLIFLKVFYNQLWPDNLYSQFLFVFIEVELLLRLTHLEMLSGEQAEMLVSKLSELSTLTVSKLVPLWYKLFKWIFVSDTVLLLMSLNFCLLSFKYMWLAERQTGKKRAWELNEYMGYASGVKSEVSHPCAGSECLGLLGWER